MATNDSSTVRRTFLDYFARQGHKPVASASLVPAQRPDAAVHQRGDEPVQGRTSPARRSRAVPRATSAQKCVRAGGKHNDLENVGRTARHHTFFEMLGNFSFGDYFKADAIAFAYELLTKDYAIDPKRLVYTVHESRRRGARAVEEGRRLGDDRVISLGDKDNFWAMGETGPCGPCSEIHFLQGDDIPCAEEAAGRKLPGAGLRLRPLDRDLEPGVHAVRAGRPGRPPPAAQAVRRHRHGARAAVRGAERRALELRDRPAARR